MTQKSNSTGTRKSFIGGGFLKIIGLILPLLMKLFASRRKTSAGK